MEHRHFVAGLEAAIDDLTRQRDTAWRDAAALDDANRHLGDRLRAIEGIATEALTRLRGRPGHDVCLDALLDVVNAIHPQEPAVAA